MRKLVAALSVVVLLSVRAGAQPLYNLPPTGECLTNWCEVVRCPDGVFVFSNIVIWPEPPVCAGTYVSASPNMGSICADAEWVYRSAPQTTNCLPSYQTNEFCPASVTNWWVLTGPDGFLASDGGLGLPPVQLTNCGDYTITFHEIWANWNPCEGTNSCPGGEISISSNFTVKAGLLRIIMRGNGTGPLWPPDWATKLANVLAALTSSPFTFTDLPGFQTTTLTNYSLFCCNCTTGGSGMVNEYYWRANVAETGFGASTTLSLLSGLPDWLESLVEAVQAAFPDETDLINQIVNLISVTAGFEATGSADWKQVTFSDECWGCTQNPEMGFGTSTANLNGEVAVHSSLFGVHLIALAGYVNAQTRGWAQYVGPSPTDSDWYVQTHYTYHLYSSAVVGNWTANPIHWLPQDGTYVPNPAVPVRVCLGPNFVAP